MGCKIAIEKNREERKKNSKNSSEDYEKILSSTELLLLLMETVIISFGNMYFYFCLKILFYSSYCLLIYPNTIAQQKRRYTAGPCFPVFWHTQKSPHCFTLGNYFFNICLESVPGAVLSAQLYTVKFINEKCHAAHIQKLWKNLIG